MNGIARRRFWIALALSLMLHLAALVAPGWGLPLLDDAEDDAALLATLVVPRPPPAPANPVPPARPKPKPQPRPTLPAPVPTDTLAMPLQEAESEPEPTPAPEMPPIMEEAPAVPPAPTIGAVPPAPGFSGAWPRQGRIVYQVTRGEGGLIIGQAEHSWQHDGTAYELRAITETVGLAALFKSAQVVQVSRGVFASGGLQPGEFRTERDGKPKDSVRFDAVQGRIFFGRGGSADHVAGAQDMLSLFHQLSTLHADGEYALSVATGRKLSTYRVTVAGVVRLEIPSGEFAVRHIKISGSAVEDATEIWYDVDTNMPLKIRHRDRKGEVFEEVAMEIELKESQ
jgi:hypothetical protein